MSSKLHVFYPKRLKTIYSGVIESVPSPSKSMFVYHEHENYGAIVRGLKDVEGPFIAELSLPMAANLIERNRTKDEMVILGMLTSLDRGTEMTSLYYPKGKLKHVQHLEVADIFSNAAWLTLMFLKSLKIPFTEDPVTFIASIRFSEYKDTLDYAIRSLRTGVIPLLDTFLVAGWPQQFKELVKLAEGRYDHTEVFDWYLDERSQLSNALQFGIPSKVIVARKCDVDIQMKLYRDYIDIWQKWKSSATKPDQRFHMLSSEVVLNDIEKNLACEFISKANQILGDKLLEQIGVCDHLELSIEKDFKVVEMKA